MNDSSFLSISIETTDFFIVIFVFYTLSISYNPTPLSSDELRLEAFRRNLNCLLIGPDFVCPNKKKLPTIENESNLIKPKWNNNMCVSIDQCYIIFQSKFQFINGMNNGVICTRAPLKCKWTVGKKWKNSKEKPSILNTRTSEKNVNMRQITAAFMSPVCHKSYKWITSYDGKENWHIVFGGTISQESVCFVISNVAVTDWNVPYRLWKYLSD